MDDNKPVASSTVLPANATYIKENKSNTFNIDNSDVTFNVSLPQPGAANSAEQMIAVHNFSRQYYQLLVTRERDVFQKNFVTVSDTHALSRLFVPPEILERCSSLSESGKAELRTFPALVCMANKELHGVADPNQWAMYAYITNAVKEGNNIKVEFQPILPIRQSVLCDVKNAPYFNLDMDCAETTLNCCAWYVFKTDLFEAFDRAGITGVPRPM